MNITQITPGAGGMYCGGCFRDNALVGELRKQGHSVLMIPLYLPLTLDEADNSAGTPIFFSGINVYLEQTIPLFSKAPQWLHNLLSLPALLKLASGFAAKTRAEELGDLTLSMIRGEEGRQARELETLVEWLKQNERPEMVCLSNVLLAGMARRIKQELDAPVACLLTGEDYFLDSLPEKTRALTWETLAERCRDIDVFISPSRYFAELMRKRLHLRPEQVRVVFNGINLDGYTRADAPPAQPILGYFGRMCQEKGLDTLIAAFLEIRQRGRVPNLKLKVGGGLSPVDEKHFLAGQKRILERSNALADVEFHPNLDRAGKIEFLRSLTVFSTPALYGEAFGLYVIEALACGIPVVQPRHAAFPELIEATGGGVLAEPNPKALALAIEELLLDPAKRNALADAGYQAARARFGMDAMTSGITRVFEEARHRVPQLARA